MFFFFLNIVPLINLLRKTLAWYLRILWSHNVLIDVLSVGHKALINSFNISV